MTSRRKFITKAALTSGAALVSTKTFGASNKQIESEQRLKILVTGAHPDDPETGMGGTINKFTSLGHEVVCVYLTTGEAGIPGVSHDKAAQIRKEEAMKACEILKARPVFLGQIDGSTEITSKWYHKMYELLSKEKPDMVFTHWPIDTHRDHRICSNLTFDAWNNTGRKAAFYYYEVVAGGQTQNFQPDTFVDISSVIETKWKACFIHKSQKIKEYYPDDHAKMELFRGIESGADYGEAFVHHRLSPYGIIP